MAASQLLFQWKSLKIPMGQSESVDRRTDNTMAKRKVQKDKQRSTKHTYKTKDRVTRTPLKTGGELMCSGSDTHRVDQTLDILFKQTIYTSYKDCIMTIYLKHILFLNCSVAFYL